VFQAANSRIEWNSAAGALAIDSLAQDLHQRRN